MIDVEKKRLRERLVVEQMIGLYCHDRHHSGDRLCPDCAALRDYALARIERCPLMATKTFCSQCKVHCYAPRQKEAIRQVMRYSGPRMLLRHPLMTVHHGLDTLRARLTGRP
ncbi:nitrous oxide-stimulated promoter family protein [Olsenella urininfantis]|uniref:nitrous oxide-stimulated promoter family protein n=1 Tax=Olsenella urininfantis TaxID=1871033 RepID=UPI0009863C34|nr:nitrous oxide-stimulated promoter family protein [Olsenella urininfantis]